MSDLSEGRERSTADVQTVEQLVRQQLAAALGGGRGILEAAVPTVSFTISWLLTHDLRTSLGVSIGLAVLLIVVRLVQRSSTQFVINAFVGIAIAAVFASRTGEAKDVFLPGILYNGAYAVGLVLSILVGWPLVGFLVGAVTNDPTGWRRDRAMVRLCARLTWLLALPCIVRVAVQYPLYLGDHVGLLGTSKVVLGWPLQVAALLAMAALLGRNATPLERRPAAEA